MKKRTPSKRAPLRAKKSRGNDDVAPMNLKWQKQDEEISSDEDDDDDENASVPSASEDDDDINESAEDKRRRLARGYLQQVSDLVHDEDSDDESQIDAHLSERLKKERLLRKGDLYRVYADQFEALDTSSLATRHYYGHSGAITTLALSADETMVITGSKDNSIVKWDSETGQKQYLKNKWSRTDDAKQSHEGEVLAVAISHDGRYVAGAGKDCHIRVYDKRSKYAEVHVFKSHKEPVAALTFQAKSYAMFSASHDRCIKYWDLNEMAYIETLFGHQDAVLALDCWHKLRPVSASNDRSLRRWKVEESSHLVFRGHKGPIDAVQILTEDTFVSGSQDGRLCLWKESRKTPVATAADCHGLQPGGFSARWISALAAIKASDTFATGSNDGFVRIWSAQNDRIRETASVPVIGFVNALALSNRLLVAGCGREHRLGRWWNEKGAKDRLSIIRLPSDFAQSTQNVEDGSSSAEESDYDSQTSSDESE